MCVFSHQKYVVGAQKNHLHETVLLSTQNTCLILWLRKYSQFYAHCFVCIKVLYFSVYFSDDTFTSMIIQMWPLLSLKKHQSQPKKLAKVITKMAGRQTVKLGQCMRFPTIWYVRPAKPQISLRIRAV